MDYNYTWTWGFFVVPLLFFFLVFGLFAWAPRRRYWSEDSSYRDYDYSGRGGVFYPYAWGSHWGRRAKGRGPKNYRRSDERITEEINDRLGMGELDASEILVSCNNGHVTLTGSVSSRAEKREAEWITDSTPGVVDVENRISFGARSMKAA